MNSQDVKRSLEALCKDMLASFNLDQANAELSTFEEKLTKGFNRDTAKRHGLLAKKVEDYVRIQSDLSTLMELLSDNPVQIDSDLFNWVEESTRRARDFIILGKFIGKHDDKNVLLTLEPGEVARTSPEGLVFIDLLGRAYTDFAKRRGLEVEVLSTCETDGAVILYVKGDFAYGYLREEHGKCSAIQTNFQKNERHTKYFSVTVEPLVEDNLLEISDKDLKYDFIAASTVGGQNANRSRTNVRITHIPTGISAVSRTRSRSCNLQEAMIILKNRVSEYYEQQRENPGKEREEPFRGGRSRVYDLSGQGMVRDTVTQEKYTGTIEDFFKNGFDEMILARHGISTRI